MLARRRCACAGLRYLSLRTASAGRVSVAPAGEITAQQAAWEVINACPAALRLRGPTMFELTGYIRRPGKRSATRQNNRATGLRGR